MQQDKYQYKECGLDNVHVTHIGVKDDAGEQMIIIPKFNQLHDLICQSIITSSYAMRGQELRYVRTHLDLTQQQLAEKMGKDRQTIGRWEKDECNMDTAQEHFIRSLALKTLNLESNIENAGWVQGRQEIQIDGSDAAGSGYRLVA